MTKRNCDKNADLMGENMIAQGLEKYLVSMPVF